MLKYDSGHDTPNHEMIDAIKELIENQHTASNANFNGKWYLEGYTNSIVIRRRTNET